MLDGEFSPLLSQLGVAEDDPRVAALVAEEERRVEDASLVAQLLAPLLQAQGASAPIATDEKVVAFEPPALASPAGPLSIADMIDGMLAQERRARTR